MSFETKYSFITDDDFSFTIMQLIYMRQHDTDSLCFDELPIETQTDLAFYLLFDKSLKDYAVERLCSSITEYSDEWLCHFIKRETKDMHNIILKNYINSIKDKINESLQDGLQKYLTAHDGKEREEDQDFWE